MEDKRMVVLDPRNNFSVPAIPDETLKKVYGTRTIDPRVELAVLVAEYWLRDGLSPWQARRNILEFLRRHIGSSNISDFISLLSKRGYAEKFFDLTSSTIDEDGALRSYLNELDVSNYEINYYRDWDGSDTAGVLAGCVVGIGESFATIVVDIIEMGKLLLQLAQYQMKTIKRLVTDPEAGLADLHNQAEMIGSLLDSLVEQLDISRLPSEVVNTWNEWNVEFEKHLENHEPFDAGRHLGRIAGDLWQLLTGIRALGQILRTIGKKAIDHAPLLFRSIRSTAAKSQEIIEDMAKLLLAIGRNMIDEIPTVGMDVLRTLFPPKIIDSLFKEGRVILTHLNLSLIQVFNGPYELAFQGFRMPRDFGIIIFEDSKPVFMAANSDKLGGYTRGEAIDYILDNADKFFRERGRRPNKMAMKEAAVKAKQIQMIEQSLESNFQILLQKIAYDCFLELRQSKKRFYPRELGQLIHKRMAIHVTALITKNSPGAWFRTEKKLRTIVDELLKLDKGATENDIKKAQNSLDQTVAKMLSKHPDVLDRLGVEKDPSARTEKAIKQFLKDHFGLKGSTTAGDLQTDLTIADPNIKKVINVDWTASTNSDQFEKLWEKVKADLGKKFSGNWDELDKEYAKAGKGKAPEEVKQALERLTWHAIRETVIRQTALEEALGMGWNILSKELTYDGIAKLFKKEADLKSNN
ncbi:MAG TPA: hypothetical protein VNM69_06425 [Bacillus sp. (in: firmicutes)]|nr:hypothetical protein [Bacillus sp. (in: firmicutes)]